MFGLMKREHFWGLKMFPFYLEHEETLFLRLNRGLIPLENCKFEPYENFPF